MNQQIKTGELSNDKTKISWTRALKRDHSNNVQHAYDDTTFRIESYRPFNKIRLYYHRPFIECPGIFDKIIPQFKNNRFICVNGIGSSKLFTCLISDSLPSLDYVEKTQCFPLYWYEENKHQQATLFDDIDTEKYIRRDGITDWILKEVRKRFGGTKAITKEHIFYYVYGILHSRQYRERFADNLKKSLPRIPIIENVQDFMAFNKAGKELADLHLNYEQGINEKAEGQEDDYPFFAYMPMLAYRNFGVKVCGDMNIWNDEWTEDTYRHFAVEKMAFTKVRDENKKLIADKTRITYNGHITIENIPLKAYEYVVNGKSAIEWIMERYAITIDKASLIKNDPNDWAREHNQPRYILDLLLSVIMLSCETVDIVNSLPKLDL